MGWANIVQFLARFDRNPVLADFLNLFELSGAVLKHVLEVFIKRTENLGTRFSFSST
jgi:hypothetical protein